MNSDEIKEIKIRNFWKDFFWSKKSPGNERLNTVKSRQRRDLKKTPIFPFLIFTKSETCKHEIKITHNQSTYDDLYIRDFVIFFLSLRISQASFKVENSVHFFLTLPSPISANIHY